MKWILLALGVGFSLWVLQHQLPDIQRYLRMRSM
jgi:hypothetical protein